MYMVATFPDALIVKLFHTVIPSDRVQLVTDSVEPATVNTPPILVYNSVLPLPKNTVLDTVKFPVLLIFKLQPNSPVPLHVLVPVPRIVMSVVPPNVFVTVKFPFTFKGLPFSDTELAAPLEDVNEPVIVKGPLKVITVVVFMVLAIITEVGQETPFDVIVAVFADSVRFDAPVIAVKPVVIVKVPPFISSVFARFSVPVVNVKVFREHRVPIVVVVAVLTSIGK